MKDFKNIAVGDYVYISTSVKFGWNSGKGFTIKEKVVRLTKTQFITESGGRFKKDSGSMIGGYRSAKLEGVDQTKEMKDFEEKIMLINKIDSKFYDFSRVGFTKDSDNGKLRELLELTHKMQSIIDDIKSEEA